MKQIYKFITAIVIIWVVSSEDSYAQTTNSGKIYVSPETQLSIVDDFKNEANAEFYNDGETFIYSDFVNEGEINFFDNTGLTRFLGLKTQNLAGPKVSYLFNVQFNNASSEVPFHLSGSINIEGKSDFSRGIVDNDNYDGSIAFGKNAEHINTSDLSHVDGKVTRYGEESFIFPIGDGGFYRQAGIAELNDSMAVTKGKYFFENSNDLYPHDSRSDLIKVIDDREYWTIEDNGDSDGILLSLSWRDETTPSEILVEPREEAIHIVRWDELENRWIDEGGVIDEANHTVSTMVEKFGVFTLARVLDSNNSICQVTVYNAVTPNGDGVNDHFVIKTENSCEENISVEIYNRWGVKVFETDNYGEQGDLFDGYSNGRRTIDGSEQLPTGTYFYILKIDYEGNNQQMQVFKKAGYLYLNGN